MKPTKKLTLSALLSALGVVMISVGAIFELFDLSILAFVSLFVAFAYIELGSPYTFLVWIVTSLLSFILFPGAVMWIEYFAVFGIYPILKGYIERLGRLFWWPLKILYASLSVILLIFAVEFITGTPFFTFDATLLKVGICVLLIFAFALYDVFLTVLIRYYMRALRPRIKTLLK